MLELYNAINETNYTNLDEFEITTLEDVVYLSLKNDLSFIIGSTLNLYEHQSTYNPHMAIRGLIYFARFYEIIDKVYELESEIEKSINKCIENDVMADILLKCNSEVFNMLLTKYDEKKHMKSIKDEGGEEDEEHFGTLTAQFLEQGRIDDIIRASKDKEYR